MHFCAHLEYNPHITHIMYYQSNKVFHIKVVGNNGTHVLQILI